MSLPRLVSSLLPAALLMASCVDGPALGDQHLPGWGGNGGGVGCPEWGCTGNSPVMGPYAFHELDLDGSANAEGVRIDGAMLGGNRVEVAVRDGDRLIGVDSNGAVLEGAALAGLTFNVETPTNTYLLTIAHVTPRASSPTRYWIGSNDRVETYELIYADKSTPDRTRPVCGNPPGHEVNGQGLPLWGNPIEAIITTGDRYDAKSKTVTAATYADAGNWITLKCAGSALAKLHLARHDTSGSDAQHVTSREERQALLKAFTGDFCGIGYGFTKPGTPLTFENTSGWTTFDGTETGFEAFWTEDGATCLTQHRIDKDYYDEVIAACGLPACDGHPFPSAWDAHAYLKTAIPSP